MLTVVSGAPCSGKTTFVLENAKADDVVIDLDRIAVALTVGVVEGHDFSKACKAIARSARDAAKRKALEYASNDRGFTVWLIESSPAPSAVSLYRQIGAKFVVCNPGLDVCLERLKDRPVHNRMEMDKVIREWYANRV